MPKKRQPTKANRDRIRELQRTIEKRGGTIYVGAECSPEIERRFLEHVLAFENDDGPSFFERLTAAGMDLPPPEQLNDELLHDKLWEVVTALALLGAYLYSTDYLSDRELYSYLWREALREPTVVMPHDQTFAMHIDLVGSGSEEDIANYLRYYADEPTRQDWALEFPDTPVPAHEQPPCDRDRFLPRRDFEGTA